MGNVKSLSRDDANTIFDANPCSYMNWGEDQIHELYNAYRKLLSLYRNEVPTYGNVETDVHGGNHANNKTHESGSDHSCHLSKNEVTTTTMDFYVTKQELYSCFDVVVSHFISAKGDIHETKNLCTRICDTIVKEDLKENILLISSKSNFSSFVSSQVITVHHHLDDECKWNNRDNTIDSDTLEQKQDQNILMNMGNNNESLFKTDEEHCLHDEKFDMIHILCSMTIQSKIIGVMDAIRLIFMFHDFNDSGSIRYDDAYLLIVSVLNILKDIYIHQNQTTGSTGEKSVTNSVKNHETITFDGDDEGEKEEMLYRKWLLQQQQKYNYDTKRNFKEMTEMNDSLLEKADNPHNYKLNHDLKGRKSKVRLPNSMVIDDMVQSIYDTTKGKDKLIHDITLDMFMTWAKIKLKCYNCIDHLSYETLLVQLGCKIS